MRNSSANAKVRKEGEGGGDTRAGIPLKPMGEASEEQVFTMQLVERTHARQGRSVKRKEQQSGTVTY